MSTAATTWVWKHSQAESTDLLVLLAIADSANPEGEDAWPALQTIAEMARVSIRTVQRSIQALAKSGEIAVEKNAGGKRELRCDRRPNRYSLPLMRGDKPDTSTVANGVTKRGDTPDVPSTHGVTKAGQRGDTPGTSNGVTLLSHKQNLERPIERADDPVEAVDIPNRVAEVRDLITPRAVGE